MIPDQIEREILINAPVEKVWAVLTEAEHLPRGSSQATATVDLRPGGLIDLRWEEWGTFLFRIVQVEPMRVFSFRWARPTDVEPVAGNSTLVEFTLTPEGEGTRLRVVETGFRDLDLPDEEKIARATENTGGWEEQLAEIQAYAEKLAA
jgi:uncharacterized protein YndB with AHSA1/START domain